MNERALRASAIAVCKCECTVQYDINGNPFRYCDCEDEKLEHVCADMMDKARAAVLAYEAAKTAE